jgi:hypothetical protein
LSVKFFVPAVPFNTATTVELPTVLPTAYNVLFEGLSLGAAPPIYLITTYPFAPAAAVKLPVIVSALADKDELLP